MKASELRIGNYINGGDGLAHVVKSISQDGVQSVGLYHQSTSDFLNPDNTLQGISLTSNWLLLAGFKDDRIMLPGDGELEIRLKGNTFHIWPTDGQTESHNYRNHIYHVHQLQNLYFALTGEELTIKEPAV